MKRNKKKKKGASVQELIGLKAFTDYGVTTERGELLFFQVTPINLSVLSSSSVEIRIRQLTLALSAIPDVEIVCTDAAECFDGNKAYLAERLEKEPNSKVKDLLKKDMMFLDGIQSELSTARQFLFIARCRNMNSSQVFTFANSVLKVISEQGFDAHRLGKPELKRMLALYFGASMFGERMPDIDGGQYFDASAVKAEVRP